MGQPIDKYADKLVQQGLCAKGIPLVGLLDDELTWNREDSRTLVLEEATRRLNINSILFAQPVEPYRTMLDNLSVRCPELISPEDSETRTFLHDIPVVADFTSDAIVAGLKRRKGLYVCKEGIVTCGTVSPEQAFVTFCSILFAVFVKTFVDFALAPPAEESEKMADLIGSAIEGYRKRLASAASTVSLADGPFTESRKVLNAMTEAGKAVVNHGLVDSYFGNLSYRLEDVIYISQTTSSLDELAGLIDACPLDSSSCAGLTASTELTAHRIILGEGGRKAILHGHPKFSVIASMLCDEAACEYKGKCHILCPRSRMMDDIPIVPGEPGSGRHGLSRTLPPAFAGRRGVIVYGHGLFTAGQQDFTDAFENMIDIEIRCLDSYRQTLS